MPRWCLPARPGGAAGFAGAPGRRGTGTWGGLALAATAGRDRSGKSGFNELRWCDLSQFMEVSLLKSVCDGCLQWQVAERATAAVHLGRHLGLDR